SAAGSDGAAGEQAVAVVGKTPAGAPIAGNVDPPRSIAPHVAIDIEPCSVVRPEPDPVGRTSPDPFVHVTLPKYERRTIVPPRRPLLFVVASPVATRTAWSKLRSPWASTAMLPPASPDAVPPPFMALPLAMTRPVKERMRMRAPAL